MKSKACKLMDHIIKVPLDYVVLQKYSFFKRVTFRMHTSSEIFRGVFVQVQTFQFLTEEIHNYTIYTRIMEVLLQLL